MSEEKAIDMGRIEQAAPWRWLLFGLLLAGTLFLLTYWAMDQRNVVWEDGKAACPHCRTAAPSYSERCTTCNQPYDWVPTEVMCDLCFTKTDVARIRATAARVEKEAGENPDPETARYLRWAREISAGACVYCGGTGKDLMQPEGTDPRPCPVCLGKDDCVQCSGDGFVWVGDQQAHRDLIAHFAQRRELEGQLDSAPLDKLVDAVRSAINDLRGHDEIRKVVRADGETVVGLARKRRDAFVKQFPLVETE